MHQPTPPPPRGPLASRRRLGSALVFAAPRVRPPMPKITAPVTFGTPEADRILEAMQVFPPDNAWNQDISKMPVREGLGGTDRARSGPTRTSATTSTWASSSCRRTRSGCR